MEDNTIKYLSKLDILRSQEKVVFCYRTLDHKVEGKYVGLSSLRMDAVVCTKGRVFVTRAAPLLAMRQSLPAVVFSDNNLMYITSGNRKNIIIKGTDVRDSEIGVPANMVGTVEITEDTTSSLLSRVYAMTTGAYMPGLNMKIPDMFRCTRKPSNLRPAFSAELKELIHAEKSDTVEQLKEKFVKNIAEFAIATHSGYVLPFAYVHAGGMVICDGTGITQDGLNYMQVRSPQLFINYIKSHQWDMGAAYVNL